MPQSRRAIVVARHQNSRGPFCIAISKRRHCDDPVNEILHVSAPLAPVAGVALGASAAAVRTDQVAGRLGSLALFSTGRCCSTNALSGENNLGSKRILSAAHAGSLPSGRSTSSRFQTSREHIASPIVISPNVATALSANRRRFLCIEPCPRLGKFDIALPQNNLGRFHSLRSVGMDTVFGGRCGPIAPPPAGRQPAARDWQFTRSESSGRGWRDPLQHPFHLAAIPLQAQGA